MTGRAVTITDPLIKYQSLVATGICSPDASQHRLAHHLQKVYLRLKDYTPAPEYRSRLQQVTRALEAIKREGDQGTELASPSHPIRGNPLFATFFGNRDDGGRDSLSLTKVLTSHQSALHIDSPKGLFLSGDVGRGKSMLLDLLADGLPTRGKKRWHFNSFMLHTFANLEQFRKSQPQVANARSEYSLLWMAKDMVEKTPILFLDEFQLPDRASSKIMNNLFIAFFQLGGVLIASSNRMPEELEKAIGVSYSPPQTGGLFDQVMGIKRRLYGGGELFGQTSDFANFLEVLKARCDFWHMEGSQDWRRREAQVIIRAIKGDQSSGSHVIQTEAEQQSADRPNNYFLSSDPGDKWARKMQRIARVSNPAADNFWKPATLIVYGRHLTVPRQNNGLACWNFDELVGSFGPADYITLASNYHTFIIDQVPTLPFSMKNEARRFITLLDALYESRCKLVLRAQACPDDLFFPETKVRSSSSDSHHDEAGDATYSETVAEVFQDQMSPFRPNVSTYADSRNAKYDPDQDSDFKLDLDKKVDFTKTGAFTGEDERFSYKRATSRLWELCSAQWHARTGDWWHPLPNRHWEGGEASKPQPSGPRRRRQIRQITNVVGLCLAVFCLFFAFRGTPKEQGHEQGSSSSSSWLPKKQLSKKTLNNLSLTEKECRATFPDLTRQVDEIVAQGPFEVKHTGDNGPLQGRIKDGQISILHSQRRSDLSKEMVDSRTASLHQLHRALITSPEPIPDTIFTLNFQDQPFGTSWTYSRQAVDPALRPSNPHARSFPMPHFSHWAWDLPFVGSIPRASSAIDTLESVLSFPSKIPKAVWRGTTWYNSVHSPGLRQKLVAASKNQPWADVQPLVWNATDAKQAANALPIEDFCKYKYIIHTEGVTYSGRFQFLQMCESVVLTPPIKWLQHTSHLVRPLFSSTILEEAAHMHSKDAAERILRTWPTQYQPEEANIVFVAPDWSDLGEVVGWLEAHPEVAKGIAKRQRSLFVGGGYFSPAAEVCYWRSLVRGWAKTARVVEGVSYEAFSLSNGP
ncbi:AFG1-like ATPase domain containing protein [Rhypophila decipiens]